MDKQTIIAIAIYMVFSTAISSLPPPQADSSPWYEWFYKFANGLSANITALRGKAAFDPKTTGEQTTEVTTARTVTTKENPAP